MTSQTMKQMVFHGTNASGSKDQSGSLNVALRRSIPNIATKIDVSISNDSKANQNTRRR